MMKKNVLLLFSLLLIGTSVWAIPAKQGIIKAEQPDGYVLDIRLHGDERQHHVTTADGYRIVEGEDGYYYYVVTDKEGRYVPSQRRARNVGDRSCCDRRFLKKKSANSLSATIR